ncbi:helix-turn-helix domain-containing protein [Erythrobacter alti]|uniref:helix-turn-helix domain-containing protein n=1 Tax=Erythrobacter alti TaxID=1896145 RepID=UPI003BF4667D
MSFSISPDQRQLGYSIKNAARAVDCSERTIYNLVDSGKLRLIKVGRRSIVPASDLRSLVGE